MASGRSCEDEGPVEVKEEGPGVEVAPEVGGWRRVRMDVRTGMVSRFAGERAGGRVLVWLEQVDVMEVWEVVKEGEVAIVGAVAVRLWLSRVVRMEGDLFVGDELNSSLGTIESRLRLKGRSWARCVLDARR